MAKINEIHICQYCNKYITRYYNLLHHEDICKLNPKNIIVEDKNYICELCGKIHDGTYGSKRFCSQKCARCFSTYAKREEINTKVSLKLHGREPVHANIEKWKKTYYENHENHKNYKIQEYTECEYCGNSIILTQSKKKYKRHYCNGTCRNKDLNRLKIIGGLLKGYNVSKWETIFHEILNDFNINYIANCRTILSDGLELDIWLPDYNIGIELNGIYHYSLKPYGNNYSAYAKRIRKDFYKRLEMEQLGYKLYVIEDRNIIDNDYKNYFINFIKNNILIN